MKKTIKFPKLLNIIWWLVVTYVFGGIWYAFSKDVTTFYKWTPLLVSLSVPISIVSGRILMKSSYVRGLLRETTAGDFSDFYRISKVDVYVIAVILLFALVLRVIGFNWGLVASWQPDEAKLLMSPTLMAQHKALYAQSTLYPNQFVSKIVAIIIFIYAHIFHLSLYFKSMIEAYFIFRLIVAVFGTAMVWVSFLIGNRIKQHLGLVLAGLCSIHPYFINLSKQVTGDVTTAFFLSLVMLFSIRYIYSEKEIHKDKYLILMTMGVAMATLEKWHGAVGIGYVGIVILLHNDGVRDFIIRGFKALAMYLLWMFMLAPNIIIKLRSTIVDGFLDMAVYDDRVKPPFHELLFDYLRFGFEHIGGVIYIILVMIGIVIVALSFRRHREYIVLLMGIIKTFALCMMNRAEIRWNEELYFTEIIFAGIAVFSLVTFSIGEKRTPILRLIPLLGILGGAIMFADLLTGTLFVDVVAFSNDRDSRLVQRRDCLAMGITPDNTISQYYTGFSPASGCDKEYPDYARKISDWSVYIIEEEGCLYRTSKCPDYLCLNIGTYYLDQTLSRQLQDYFCNPILKYDVICDDVFLSPFSDMSTSWDDCRIVYNNVRGMKEICTGALFGDGIEVYYVGSLPIYG